MTTSKFKSTHPATIATRSGVESDVAFGAVMPPLYLSSNYTFDGYKGKRQYDYTRSGNPTRDLIGQAIADLEGGYGGVMTASGMSALDLLFHYVDPGDLIFAPHDCYGGTYRLLQSKSERGFYRVKFIDQGDLEALKDAFAIERPKLILIETPSNPLLRVVDIKAICALAKQHDTLVAADNTFLSPALQKPFELGADVVIHSTTKYLNGHSDVVGGAVVSKTEALHQFFFWWANNIGNTASPFDSYMTLRGLRTLAVRIQQQEQSADQLAHFLKSHPAVAKVYYPGLTEHPGHELAKNQQQGFGAMISFELAGDEETLVTLLENLQLFSLAESLGGVESLIAHPATMTHAGMQPEARRTAGISDQLLRLSIGLESVEDLQSDLETALTAASLTLAQPNQTALV